MPQPERRDSIEECTESYKFDQAVEAFRQTLLKVEPTSTSSTSAASQDFWRSFNTAKTIYSKMIEDYQIRRIRVEDPIRHLQERIDEPEHKKERDMLMVLHCGLQTISSSDNPTEEANSVCMLFTEEMGRNRGKTVKEICLDFELAHLSAIYSTPSYALLGTALHGAFQKLTESNGWGREMF